MIFKKNRTNNDVLFIDASSEFYKDKNQNRLNDALIAKIAKTYNDRISVDKYAYLATIEQIEQNDYNLNIPRYVDTYEEEKPIDIQATKDEIKRIENELNLVQNKMTAYLKELGL